MLYSYKYRFIKNMVDIKIYGVKQRDFLIKPLQKELELEDLDIVYDDRPNGGLVLYTFEKAFKQPIPEGVTHRLCIPDDMIVCDDFKKIINQMVEAQPDKIIGLWPYNFKWLRSEYIKKDTPYIKANGICGNGIIMPTKYIEPFFDWAHNEFKDNYDKQIEEVVLWIWAYRHNIPVINTIPATVQHIGDDYGTLLPYIVQENRKTIYFQQHIPEDIDWTTTKVETFN